MPSIKTIGREATGKTDIRHDGQPWGVGIVSEVPCFLCKERGAVSDSKHFEGHLVHSAGEPVLDPILPPLTRHFGTPDESEGPKKYHRERKARKRAAIRSQTGV